MNINVREFKSSAWQNANMAENYKKTVNETKGYQDFLVDIFLQPILSLFPNLDARILDLGCGTGILFSKLARHGYRVDGVDISDEMLSRVNNSDSSGRCNLYRGDIFNLSNLDQSSYDAVVSRWVIPHFDDWRNVLTSVRRVLKPRGVFYFDMTNSDNYEFAKKNFQFKYDHFPYDNRMGLASKDKFYASVSCDELDRTVSEFGFDLVDVSPCSFFYGNPVFATSCAEENTFGEFSSLLDTLIGTEAGRQFCSFFETNISPRLPMQCSNLLRVTLRAI